MKRTYLTSSWVSPKLHVGASSIQGDGVFTSSTIEKDEVVIVWGGILLSSAAIRAGLGTPHTQVAVSERRCLATPLDAQPTIDDYMNHSCSPNIWMQDEVTLTARSQIQPGEELTADYAIWLNDKNYKMKVDCNCGSANCRTKITGNDWKIPDVVKLNFGHFSPFLNRRISRLHANLR